MIDVIRREIAKLSLYYPGHKLSAEQIEVVAHMWLEDLGHIQPDRFVEAVALARSRSEFMIGPKHILDVMPEVYAKHQPKQLPEPKGRPATVEEIRATVEEIRAAKEKLFGRK